MKCPGRCATRSAATAGVSSRKIETQAGGGGAQAFTVFALQRRAGQHRTLTGGQGPTQLLAEAVEPAGAVVVVEGNAGTHLGDIGGRVERIAFNGRGAAALAQGLTDAGFATAGNTHDDQGGNWLTHVTPQRADSATFASSSSSTKTVSADAFLSFLWVAAYIVRQTKERGSGTPRSRIAAVSGQRYLSDLNFVWQAV